MTAGLEKHSTVHKRNTEQMHGYGTITRGARTSWLGRFAWVLQQRIRAGLGSHTHGKLVERWHHTRKTVLELELSWNSCSCDVQVHKRSIHMKHITWAQYFWNTVNEHRTTQAHYLNGSHSTKIPSPWRTYLQRPYQQPIQPVSMSFPWSCSIILP
jgi:hypothetical protein